MKTNPYYSSNVSDSNVHHNQKNCPEGKEIAKDKKKFGTNGYKLCPLCAKM